MYSVFMKYLQGNAMSLQLKKPKIDHQPTDKNEEISAQEVASFIVGGDKRPAKSRAIPRTFRLNAPFIDIMESEANRSGLGNTDVLKAALAAYANMNDGEKNHWILEAKKL